jgi:hypothetical protein
VTTAIEPFSFNRRGLLAAAMAALLGCGPAAAANAPDPVAFLTAIYRAAVKGDGPSWIDKGERPQYLSKSLVALWAQTDRKLVAGDSGPIDFDLVASTNGLTLTGFTLAVEKRDDMKATIAARLAYKEGDPNHKPTFVRYDLVREGGQWKIDEIRGGGWSARDMLTRFLQP